MSDLEKEKPIAVYSHPIEWGNDFRYDRVAPTDLEFMVSDEGTEPVVARIRESSGYSEPTQPNTAWVYGPVISEKDIQYVDYTDEAGVDRVFGSVRAKFESGDPVDLLLSVRKDRIPGKSYYEGSPRAVIAGLFEKSIIKNMAKRGYRVPSKTEKREKLAKLNHCATFDEWFQREVDQHMRMCDNDEKWRQQAIDSATRTTSTEFIYNNSIG